MRWHTEECMRYAAKTQRPWCIIECADQWRAFVAWIHLQTEDPYAYGLTDSDSDWRKALSQVIDMLDIKEVNSDD